MDAEPEMARKYFGTDGIRGLANGRSMLTPEVAHAASAWPPG